MSPVDPPASAGVSARALIDRQLALLAELAEIGMEIARAAGRRTAALGEGAEAGADGQDPALAYSRAARAVRLTVALQSKLMRDLMALDGAETKARAADAAERRRRIHTRVEQAIEAERDDADEAERLSSNVWERLTDEDDAALLDLPVAEVVALICRDLGLSPTWAAGAFTASGDEGTQPARPDRTVSTPHPPPSSSAPCRGSAAPLLPPRQDLEPSLRLACGFPGQARE